jgi:hypothetical protein
MSGGEIALTTSGVCIALAFAEQLSSFGDTHGLLFGVRVRAVRCSRAGVFLSSYSCACPLPRRAQVEKEETRTVITDTGSKEVLHTAIDIQVPLR